MRQRSVDEAKAAAPQGREGDVTPGLPPASRWPSLAQTIAVLWFTERYVRWALRRFDSPRRHRLIVLGDYVAVWDPQQIKELFTADRELVRAGEANARALGHVVPSSLLVLDGERHVRMRRVMSPPFHGDVVSKYEETIAELAAAEVRKWPVGEVFAIHPRMQTIALEVILRAVIGVRDPARMARLRSLLPRVAQASILMYMAETNHPRFADSRIGTQLPWLRARREADTLLYEEIDSDNGDAYLGAVINETLRVRPPLDRTSRKLSAPVQIGGYLLPAGTTVVASIVGAHLSDIYPQPEQFRPERFLDQPPPPYTLIPFGGGPRRCIGASFALMEMKTILRIVLGQVALRAPTQKSERPVRTRRLTTYPARGGRVLVTSRRHVPDPHPTAEDCRRSTSSTSRVGRERPTWAR